ncbi:transmembrane protein 70 homolog, mitochondrial-like [Helicoverpa armigera]|uniref:transmembrane protein 70 homolog, mitochondrial-like n=1 Tax=Helicoverpa armigera TaxID=29058 RepID=UPI003082838E
MLRFCTQGVLNNSRVIIQPLIQKQITSKLKPIISCPGVISRHYAVKLRDEDNKLECIYYGPLTPQIKGVKVFSLSSSAAGLLAQPIIIREAATIGSTSLLVALCSVVGFFTFVTPLLLHFITKKYVTEIHYDPTTSTYSATTTSISCLHTKAADAGGTARRPNPPALDFKVEDVQVPDIPGAFTTLNAKGVPLFIEARHFTDPIHYAKMMGYDKPMDFKLGDQTEDSSKSN